MDPADTLKYKPGDSLTCRVEAPEPGGYTVTLLPTGIKGFLPSHEPIEIGRIVPTTFVCMNGTKALLAYAFMIGTTARVQNSVASDSETAFSVWVDSYPRGERMQRAVDLFMPSFSELPHTKKVSSDEADKLIGKLERDDFTGCIKIDSPAQRSRSAVLYFKGRAVGAIYGRKSLLDPYRIETSLMLMLDDMRKSTTDVEYYSLPEDFVLSLSSLFLGVLVERGYGYTNKEYAGNTLADFSRRNQTGCLSLQQALPCCIGLMCRGTYLGTYAIEAREFRSHPSYLHELIEQFPAARMEAYILPEVMTTNSFLYGYSLTSGLFASTRRRDQD